MKWQVHIKLGKKIIHIGLFGAEVEGRCSCFHDMAKKHRKEFACMNDIASDHLIEIDEEISLVVVDDNGMTGIWKRLMKTLIDSDSDESGEE